MKKFRGIKIWRNDFTVPPTEKEQKTIDKLGKPFRFPKMFVVRVNNAIVPDHRMLK